jgi:hypothetical protein
MSAPDKKPFMRVRVLGDGDLFNAREVEARGRDAWLLARLLQAGEAGVSPIENVGPRSSHYAMKLRRKGLSIETKEERHGGAFAGAHGRYILRSRVEVVEQRGLLP